MQKHVHHELICLWATTGAIIQWWNDRLNEWVDCSNNDPAWSKKVAYRVKPTPPVYEYQVLFCNGITNQFEVTQDFYTDLNEFYKNYAKSMCTDVGLLQLSKRKRA